MIEERWVVYVESKLVAMVLQQVPLPHLYGHAVVAGKLAHSTISARLPLTSTGRQNNRDKSDYYIRFMPSDDLGKLKDEDNEAGPLLHSIKQKNLERQQLFNS